METSKEPEKLRRRYTSLEKLTTLLEEVFAEGTASIEVSSILPSNSAWQSLLRLLTMGFFRLRETTSY